MSRNHTYQSPGWVPMDELLAMYDWRVFESQNKDSFYTYTGSYDKILAAERLVLWEWPGADTEKTIVTDNIHEYTQFFYAYQDSEGLKWGKSAYSSGWICLSDPENSKIPPLDSTNRLAMWSPDGVYDWSAAVTVYPPADISSSLSVRLDAQPLDLDGQPFPWRTVLPFAAAVVVGAVLGVVVVTLRRQKQK